MPRRGALALLACCALVAASGVTDAGDATAAGPSALQARLGRALRAPGIDRGQTGALAVDLSTGRVVFRRNAELPLAPASVEKLGIAYAALALLGPGYRYRTDVRGSGTRSGSTWEGDLYLVGSGDPTLGPSDLDGIARDLARAGIRRVSGAVVGDEHRYDRRRGVHGWKPSFYGIESPPLSALAVRNVTVRSSNGSAGTAAAAFRDALARRGVAVGRVTTGRTPADAVTLASDVSVPLTGIVREMNHESDNLTAELVLKELGAALVGHGTSAAGARVVRSALAAAEVPLAGMRVVDGSGLSLLDRTTAGALVALLQAAERDGTVREPFLASLPVAGVSGTLENRLERPPARGRVLAKTGTTSRASSLAGYVRGRYAFAIVQNGRPVPYWTARAAQDRFVSVLATS